MAKRGKAYLKAKQAVDIRDYSLADALNNLREGKYAKFDESVDIAIRLGVDPKYPDQMVRGTVTLPHGTGKTKRVLVIAAGEKQKEAEEAGADFIGGEEVIERIQKENWFDYDVVVTTPDMMKSVGRLGKTLGTKGLMPSPKAGTVTFNIKDAVSEIKKGRIEFRVDKTGIVHASVGKISFADEKLADNVRAFASTVIKARPAAVKGRYLKSIHLSLTMSPAVKIALQEFEA